MVRIGLQSRNAVLGMVLLAVFSLAAPSLRADDGDSREKALALNAITGEDPIKGEILTLLDDPAGTRKLLAAALPLAKEKNPPLNYNAAFILGQVALQLKDPEASQTFFRLCLEKAVKLASPQKLGQSFLGLLSVVDVMYATRKYEETTKLCQEILEFLEKERRAQGLKDEVLRRMIRAVARQGKTEEAAKMVDNLLKSRKGDWRNLELKGWLKREAGAYGEAAAIYEDLLEKIGKDKAVEKEERKDLLDEIHYILSGVYVDMNDIDKAGDHLQTLLKAHPDDPTYNNDLGYIWADHDMNLDESERMIRKALEEDRKLRLKANPGMKPEEVKENAAYLDSLGWVLYKQKKYKDALPYLLKAVDDPEGRHIEIYDHLAEVHRALGEYQQAIAAWEKGVEVAGPSKREQERKAEVQKKLKEKK